MVLNLLDHNTPHGFERPLIALWPQDLQQNQPGLDTLQVLFQTS